MVKADRLALRKENPAVWVATEAGDFIRGTVIDVQAAWSDAQYNQKDPDSGWYPLLRVGVDEATGYTKGEVLSVHAFATTLQMRILDYKPAAGETIVITYEGTGAKKPGRNPPELYRINMPERDPADLAKAVYDRLGRRHDRRAVELTGNGATGEPLVVPPAQAA